MSDHRYKNVSKKPEPTRCYHPAAAVRKSGDNWTCTPEVWTISVSTTIALRDVTQDSREATAMQMMETGMLPRVEHTT